MLTRRLRLAIVVGGFPTLSETFVLDHIAAMVERGHDVDIYPANESADANEAHPEYHRLALESRVRRPRPLRANILERVIQRHLLLLRKGLSHPVVALRSLRLWRYGIAALGGGLFHLAEQCGFGASYDVLHAHFGWSGLRTQQLREIGAISGPLVTSFHGSDITVGYRPGLKNAYAPLWRSGERFTANSSFTAQRVIQDGCPADKVVLWTEGVDTRLFAPGRRESGGPVQVLGVGRLVPVKGWDIAFRALARVRFDWHFHLVGRGPEEAGLRALADQLGLRDKITFHGGLPRNRVVEAYQRADLFVLPGRVATNGSVEAQGVVIAEAQASGLPAIVGSLGGMPEGILPEESGILFPAGDVPALARAIERLATDRDLCRRMGETARRNAQERFEQRTLYDRIEQIYGELARAHNGVY